MGFVYDLRGKLCCDFCGASGGVRKVPCPFGWCQPYAMCPECRKKTIGTRELKRQYEETHRKAGCEKNHLEFSLREIEKEEILNAGKFLRVAAWKQDKNDVKVLFRNKEGIEKAMLMTSDEYNKHSLLKNTSIEDYAGVEIEVQQNDLTTKAIAL